MTGDAEKDKELAKIKKLVQQEKSHGQWTKQAINFLSLIFLIVISLFRGNHEFAVTKCSATDWIIVVAFFITMWGVVILSAKIVAAE